MGGLSKLLPKITSSTLALFSSTNLYSTMSLAALAQERFWENKAQCEDAEKAYYMRLSGAKAKTPEPEKKEDSEELDLFGSDEETPVKPAKPSKPAKGAKKAPKQEQPQPKSRTTSESKAKSRTSSESEKKPEVVAEN